MPERLRGGSAQWAGPRRGGRGYSDDDEERRLEWELDDAMRRRMRNRDDPLGEVLDRVRALQGYRALKGIRGRLDERIGKPFDEDERLIVDRLLGEGRNVTSLAVLRSGDTTPDMVVDGRLAEIKTSVGDNARSFQQRVRESWDRQGAAYVYVNATESGIDPPDMRAAMQRIVSDGDAMYIRIIGSGYDVSFGTW